MTIATFSTQSETTNIGATKDVLLRILFAWKKANSGRRVSNYYSAVKDILHYVNFDPAMVNRSIIQQYYQKKGWSERHTWPIVAWNSFCEFGRNFYPYLFPESCFIRRPKLNIIFTLPETILQQVRSILDGHIVSTTSAKLSKSSQERILTSFRLFYTFVKQQDPAREIKNLEDFTEDDAFRFKDWLITNEVSPLTGSKVSYNTLVSFLIDLRRVYKFGVEQKKLKTNIFKDMVVSKQTIPKREFCLSKEQVEKLCSVNADILDTLPLKQRFIQARNNAMVRLQYEAGLRASEVVNLCWEDIPEHERTRTNVGPVIVRGSKARPKQHEDRVYIYFGRVDKELRKWKQIAEEYCRQTGIQPPAIVKEGKVLHPIFFSERGRILSASTYISFIFAEQLKKAGIHLPSKYKTHVIRHSRITHWVEEGYPFEKVHENARHKNLDETWRYFHSNVSKRIETVERIEGLDEKELKLSLIPPHGILKLIIDCVVEYCKTADNLDFIPYYDIQAAILRKCKDSSEAFYTFRDVVDKFKLGRTQTYERLKILQKLGLVHPLQVGSKTVYLKEEIDYIAKLVDTRVATVAFGYKEQRPTTIPEAAVKGMVRSTKIGKLHFFDPQELIGYFYEKRLKRIARNY